MTSAATIAELPKSYLPADHEDAMQQRWASSGAFEANPGSDRPAYCILIPPPNVTAALHLGHAFNNTLQDILARHHRMRGAEVLWMPGTDHAGIATQTVVEKRLLSEGVRRREMGREAFVSKVQEWKDEYEATITDQLKTMGASCDWRRQRFTMDEVCADAVREAFFRLFRDGLIERGKRLVNWDPATQTALADDEVEMVEVQGHFYYLQYPVVDDDGRETGEHVTVATTRPETMLGDTAIAVNPKDAARRSFVGKYVRLPIVDRIVPVIADDYVVIPAPDSDDPKARYASGFLKVTPAHDPNDWEIGLRHDLPVINVMAPDASISADHGWDDVSSAAQPFLGLERDAARAAVVAHFKAAGRLEAIRDYTHSVGHSYRSHVPVEPYLSDQWYVGVTDDRLVGEAQRALAPAQFDGTAPLRAHGDAPAGDGDLAFAPSRYAKTYQSWHEGLRDWCISRQLWWGHRIPVWSVARDEVTDAVLERWREKARSNADRVAVQFDAEMAYVCLGRDADALGREAETDGFRQDPDVLDTWFSSALWPLSTMGWPDPTQYPDTEGLLDTFNPTSVLCTAREIITLWVSRMVMFNRYFLPDHRVPFRQVYIHAMIQDGHGQKMSKSLGNGVDPRDIIHSHGADAMRFTLAQMATSTQDVRLPVDTVCPACEASFSPAEITTSAGHRVAAPSLTCPKCGAVAVSAYGAAVGVATPTPETPLARNSSNKFDLGRNFSNKLWNATRFALSRLTAGSAPEPNLGLDQLDILDRWIINRLHQTLHAVEDALAEYQFNAYADAMYDFIWRDFCDWYLEAVKPTIQDSPAQQQVLRTVLNAAVRLLHPVCPFVTEALWPTVQAAGAAGLDGIELPEAPVLATAAWPSIACRVEAADASHTFERIQSLTNAIRNLRGERNVPPRRRITLHVTTRVAELVSAGGPTVSTLAGLAEVIALGATRPIGNIPFAFEGEELLLSGLVDAVDLGAERNRLEKVVEEKRKAVEGFRRKLSNEGYVRNAPPAVVEETRARLTLAESDLAAAEQAFEALSGDAS